MIRKWTIRIFFSLVFLGLAFFLFVLWINLEVTRTGKKYSYDSVSAIPHNHCAVVLGTNKFISTGKVNLYYAYRIQSAVQLYKSKKVDYIIVSGDNKHRSYNEPVSMFNDLVEAGIPKDRIVLDYAGFRTLDSVVRCFMVFGQHQFTVISQPFHNHRAIYIGRKRGLEVIAFNAGDQKGSPSVKVIIREIGARVLLAYDLLTGTQPHFLGEKILIPD
ncbi:MAG TPA: ElyC/SanA/YdcF family protein [Prolixibacteraceae bacterium]|nr:ElyC/SanA/YdcF family protein [Prolixibacteraceae bacterium]